ncbi:MAG: histidinol-phosphatase, partial [Gemmatimonadales bacterium]
PYGVDLDAIIEKAAATGVALEINADPHRLDLDWRVLRRVRAAGAMVSIGADAHNVAGIGHVDYGVAMARKGWLGPDDILNARPVDGFVAFARGRPR